MFKMATYLGNNAMASIVAAGEELEQKCKRKV